MKKVKGICLILCFVLLLMAFPTAASADQNASVSDGCHSVDALKPLDGNQKMLDSAKAVMLYERKSGTMIYAYNPDEHVDPSSMVKLMTALIAV